MSPGWEMGFAPSPSFNISHSTSPAYLYDHLPSSDTLRIDDLLDFTNHEDFLLSSSSSSATADSHILPPPNPSSYPTDSSNVYSFPSSTTFPDDLYIPSEEAAELEWLSRFVDDSFSDVPPSVYTPISNQHQHNQHHHHQQQQQHLLIESCSAPGRARSKRSKANSWSMPSQSSSPSTSSSSSDLPSHAGNKDTSYNNNSINSKGKSCGAGGEASGGGGVRRCTHCASEKTPQWRTGPLGPKTLCNACGVRYKSGRLVPEYRPAASPTFVLTQHSNSHRKVLELRRQKELAAARSELLFHDYDVC
ncbi:putative transcription factor C2C2-GATA family [Dioscorea sansibarensis]